MSTVVAEPSNGTGASLQLTRNESEAVINGPAFKSDFHAAAGRITCDSYKGTPIMEDG